jgi:hypothetical protein
MKTTKLTTNATKSGNIGVSNYLKISTMMKKAVMAISALMLIATSTRAQDEKFKALFMYNFTKYIEWPQIKQTGDFVIGVLGNSAIVDELNAIAERKTVGSQNIKVKQVSTNDELTKLHILFVPESQSGQVDALADKIKGKGVVLITDKPGFAKTKSGINYINEGGKQKFEVSNKHLSEEGVKVSAQLLTLGNPVD